MEQVFKLANVSVIPFWILMIFAPNWKWTRRVIGSLWIIAIPAVLYVILILPGLASLFGELMNPQLADIAELLGTKEGATLAWLHFLAFDLFVVRCAYLDAQERHVPVWLSSPSLFLILMMGPLGLVVYLGIRWQTERSVSRS